MLQGCKLERALVAFLLLAWSPFDFAQGSVVFSNKRQPRRSAMNMNLAEAPEAKQRIPEIPGRYLYPVLAWGPNNQVAGLKEALVLGKLLNRTVVVHDILNHYGDRAPFDDAKKQQKSMKFSLVFDFDHLSRHRPVVTLEERRAAGWDGQLQAVVHFGDKFLGQMKNAHALNVSDEGAAYLDFKRFTCTAEQLTDMFAELEEYETIAVIVYENIVRDAGYGVKLRVTGEMCHDDYLQVSAQLTKSAKLVQLAQEFRKRRLSGRYLAVHIRPYPDTCLSSWQRREYDPTQASRVCKNPHLRAVFVNQTLKAIKRHGTWGLFVMCLPELRATVSEMYGAVGLRPTYYGLDDLEEAVGFRSVSLLGMLEEEIAYEADAFVGTSYSSMSSIIMQERFARGRDVTTTSVFTRTAGGGVLSADEDMGTLEAVRPEDADFDSVSV